MMTGAGFALLVRADPQASYWSSVLPGMAVIALGMAGAVAPRVLEDIGCEVIPLYCDVDGRFPNHHPDPSDPRNLADLIAAVNTIGADLGVAFDGDGDRLGVVTQTGEIIYPDRLLMLFAQDVLARNPGATVIYDVKCTGHLRPVIQVAAGVPLMWPFTIRRPGSR